MALVNRAALISSAREKIIKEGFVFAKGKSRSKLPVRPRRQYLSEELRTSRLKYLDEVIKNHEEKISFKEQQISSCLSVSNYAGCEELKNSIIDIRKVIYELGHEKKKLQNSIRKARWYQLKSANKGVSASCSHDTSSSSSCNNVSTLETTDSETQFNSSELTDDSESSNTSALPITPQSDQNFLSGPSCKVTEGQ